MDNKTDKNYRSTRDAFDLKGRVAFITGGAGLLGNKHAEAVADMGGIPALIDIDESRVKKRAEDLSSTYEIDVAGIAADITDRGSVQAALEGVLQRYGRVDILINNAANNPKVEGGHLEGEHASKFEGFSVDVWNQDLAVGLTGAFLCSQVVGGEMAERGGGVVLNIASDLALISPDQRIYRDPGLSENEQQVKPVTYSVVKTGLIGLTRYLATYWAESGVRVNALSPGGVYTNQDSDFVQRLSSLIPLGRMAGIDEYKGAIAFMVSDASSYMTGSNMVIDGGRTCW